MSLDDIWQRLVNAENEYEQAKWYFFKHCSDVLGTLRKALHIPYRRGTTLRLIKHLNIEDHKALLHDLVEEASIGHSDIQLVRDVILMKQEDSHYSVTWRWECHSPYIVDELETQQVEVWYESKCKFLSEHPDIEWAKCSLTTGEIWDAEGEVWVIEEVRED